MTDLKINELMGDILSKCDIKYKKNIISKEYLMMEYGHFLYKNMMQEEHNVGVVSHTGSICFDVINVVYAALLSILSNDASPVDVIDSLGDGDIVIYDGKKYEYIGLLKEKDKIAGFEGNRYVQLKDEHGGTWSVIEARWHLIEPYNGESERLGARGMKKRKPIREKFYQEVLGLTKNDVPSIMNKSSVIVASRQCADELVNNISICFGDKTISLLDIVTASYYTDTVDNEHTYKGNTGKNEPILKFCNKVSVVRDLIREKNKHIGVIIMGRDRIMQGSTELEELCKRRSLRYVYLCCVLDPTIVKNILTITEYAKVFSCTKNNLVQQPYNQICKKNKYTTELVQQVDRIIKKKITDITIDSFPIDFSEYKQFCSLLSSIKSDEYVSSSIKEFIGKAYSLMKLYLTMPIDIASCNSIINDISNERLLNVDTPDNKIERLNILNKESQKGLSEIIRILEKIHSKLGGGTLSDSKIVNLKGKWITSYIQKNKRKKIAIIVPKDYFRYLILNSALLPENNYGSKVSIYTYNNIDNTKTFDTIIVLGTKNDGKFNPFYNFAAKEIYCLLYPIELLKYKRNKYMADKELNSISKSAFSSELPMETLGAYKNAVDNYQEIKDLEEMIQLEEEIEKYIQNVEFTSVDVQKYSVGKEKLSAEISVVAKLEDEYIAYFSKYYKAYVLDIDGDGIKEVEVNNLSEGNAVVFTKRNNDTKDIVDTIIKQLKDNDKLSAEQIEIYDKSKIWKECLQSYRKKENLSVQEIAAKMKHLGETVTEATIRGWLDEDSYTVGPRKEESLRLIGKLTGNTLLESDSITYFNFCNKMRQFRKAILTYIGEMIKDRFRGKEPAKDSILYDIYGKLDDIIEVLEISYIRKYECQVPSSIANRPINMG